MSEKARKCEFKAHKKDVYKKGYCYEVRQIDGPPWDTYKVEDTEGLRHDVSPGNIRFFDTAEHYARDKRDPSGFVKHEKGFEVPDIKEKYGAGYALVVLDGLPVVAVQTKDENGQHLWHVNGDKVHVDKVSHYGPFVMPKE